MTDDDFERTIYSPDSTQYVKVRRIDDGEVEVESINRAVQGHPVWLDRQGLRRLREVLDDLWREGAG